MHTLREHERKWMKISLNQPFGENELEVYCSFTTFNREIIFLFILVL